MIRIEVPATTANIGPCFDTCGIALNIYNSFSFEYADTLLIEGCDEAYANENNLVFTSYKHVFDYLKLPLRNVHIIIQANVPVSRGLGSSSTCIIGGVLGANALLDYPLSKDEIFMLCTEIEGHPDNIAPALFGGLTASLMTDGKPYNVNYDINKDFKFCACIPNFELKTSLARSVLPKEVTYHDAIYNVSRAAVSLKCWETKDYELLSIALDDTLHQPYRSKLIDEYDEIMELSKKAGAIASFISGAGPTIMTIYDNDDYVDTLKSFVKDLHNTWTIMPLKVELNGALERNGVRYNGR
ncbi:MAG: homoserine kinase [Erysipelotrichales bacterium]|nr:homoserine kinase [Erysipelotrichales bacterium]